MDPWFTTPNDFFSEFDNFGQQFPGTHLPPGFDIPAPHEQALGGQFIADQNHSYAPPDPTFDSFIQGLHDTSSTGNMDVLGAAQITPTPTTGPPRKSRKKKAPTLRDEDWEPFKDRILELYETHKLPLEKVKTMIEDEFGFTAQPRQYQSRITKWGKDKNIKKVEMTAIVRKHQQREILETGKRKLCFTVRGREVEADKINRWMDRNNVPRNDLYAPSPAASPRQYRYRQADEDRLRSELSVAETLFGSEHVETLDILTMLTNVLLQQGRYKSAEEMIRRAVTGYQKTVGGDDIRTLSALELLGQVLARQGFHRQAAKFLEELLESERVTLGEEHPSTLSCMAELSKVYTDQRRWRKAALLSERVLEIKKRVCGEADHVTLRSMSDLGVAYMWLGRLEESKQLIGQALKLSKNILGDEHITTLVYEKHKKFSKAEDLRRNIRNIALDRREDFI
uniref:Clr5 domain-containing protein n=1 Tax=Fusarium oxysporum (strain Fo5176) TaxID=660025 RepID=A0A0D2XLU3_FUSOF